jgi:endonuclease/exonuclease/phosphatase family metal-dependent hydrolase
MKAITWNVHNWRTAAGRENVAAAADVLAAADADLVGLQEIVHPLPVLDVGDGRGMAALDWLAQRLGMFVVFGPWQRWPAHRDMPEGGYGNALLSRRPIIASASHHLLSTPDTESRGLLEARILLNEATGHTLTVYVTHLDYTSEEARVVQFRHARQWLIRDRNRPHLLMGDINAISAWDFGHRPEDLARLRAHPRGGNLVDGEAGPRVVAAIEKAGYTDAARLFAQPGGRTYVTAALDLRIDYHFASAALAPHLRAYGIIDTADAVSDHRPVWVEFEPPAA